ncbi:uncharacterized protein LOC128219483 [Mya arenaria]|uniref:uncharacterized protein LOC128219483 n=1 Tax=Mya arenaria TaxID=6604 RepID=UPI0022DFAB64|nr:uncharacterized protein LOC128219483 [Mya arenaria]
MEIEDAFPLPFTLIGAVVAIVSGLICLTMLKWREINKWRLKTAVAFAYGQRAKRKLKTLVNAIKRNAAIDNVHRHIENLSQTCDRDVQTDPGNEDLGLERRASMMIEAIESEGDIQVRLVPCLTKYTLIHHGDW